MSPKQVVYLDVFCEIVCLMVLQTNITEDQNLVYYLFIQYKNLLRSPLIQWSNLKGGKE